MQYSHLFDFETISSYVDLERGILNRLKFIDLTSSAFSLCSYPIALEMVATGRVDLKSLITHRFKLEQSKDAFEASGAGKDGAIKVVINCTKD